MKDYNWLKRMDNGSIGEARTKEMIIDRFWILERSVDINGADFIIQRKQPMQHISDDNAPKLGVIQAKFIQDKNTDIYIKNDYVMRYADQPRDEFFLVVHTGYEDSKKAYFLSARQISGFKKVLRNGDDYFYISGTELFDKEEIFLIKSFKVMNDFIENCLIRSEFARNRSALYSFFSVKKITHPNDIDFKYTHPISTNIVIPEVVFNIKKNAIRLREELENLAFELDEMIEDTDALKVIKKSEGLNGILDWHDNVSFNASMIACSSEEISAVEEYLNYYEKLESQKRLDFFNLIKSKLFDAIKSRINEIKISKKNSGDIFNEYRIIPYNSCINISIKYMISEGKVEVDTELEKSEYIHGQEMIEIVDYNQGNVRIKYRWGISGDLSNRNTIEKNTENAVWIISRLIDSTIIDELTD